MPSGHRESIANRVSKRVFANQSAGVGRFDLAKEAVFLSIVVQRLVVPVINTISIQFRCVTRVAKCLIVSNIVLAAQRLWNNVIDLDILFIC